MKEYLRLSLIVYWPDSYPSIETYYTRSFVDRFTLYQVNKLESDFALILYNDTGKMPVKVTVAGHIIVQLMEQDQIDLVNKIVVLV